MKRFLIDGEGRLRYSRLCMVAALGLHLTTSAAVFLIGRVELLPFLFDRNGIAVSLASDGMRYHREAIAAVQVYAEAGSLAWIRMPAPFHVKAYSVSYAVFGPVVGFNILAAEPVNAACYMFTIWLVYKLGERILSSTGGLTSSVLVAGWPSLLLHSTQLLKDPLVIVLWLILIWAISSWLMSDERYSFLTSVLQASFSVLPLWILRPDMWIVVQGTCALGLLLLVIMQFRVKQIRARASIGAVSVIVLTIVVPHVFIGESINPGDRKLAIRNQRSIYELISERRRASIIGNTADARSNVDIDVVFRNEADIFRYVPRAIEIGLFAPFPTMWFARDSTVGLTMRIASGVETCMMYVIEFFAIIGLVRKCREPAIWWLLFISAFMGTIALGFVVINIGTLYRFRYSFFILIIILASVSVISMVTRFRTSKDDPIAK